MLGTARGHEGVRRDGVGSLMTRLGDTKGGGAGSFSAQGSARGCDRGEGRWCWVPHSPLRGHEGMRVLVPTERMHCGGAVWGHQAGWPLDPQVSSQPAALPCFGVLAGASLKGKRGVRENGGSPWHPTTKGFSNPQDEQGIHLSGKVCVLGGTAPWSQKWAR